MKTTFSYNDFVSNAGCWKTERPHRLIEVAKELSSLQSDGLIHISDLLLRHDVSIKHCVWFIKNKCNCSIQEYQQIALISAKSVAQIYNKKYPNDNRISMCINITARCLKGLVSLDTLSKYRNAANDAAYAAYAAAAYAAYAADAATYAAYAAADADAATYATYDATYATYDATYATYDATYAATYAAAYAADTSAKLRKSLSTYIKSLE